MAAKGRLRRIGQQARSYQNDGTDKRAAKHLRPDIRAIFLAQLAREGFRTPTVGWPDDRSNRFNYAVESARSTSINGWPDTRFNFSSAWFLPAAANLRRHPELSALPRAFLAFGGAHRKVYLQRNSVGSEFAELATFNMIQPAAVTRHDHSPCYCATAPIRGTDYWTAIRLA